MKDFPEGPSVTENSSPPGRNTESDSEHACCGRVGPKAVAMPSWKVQSLHSRHSSVSFHGLLPAVSAD